MQYSQEEIIIRLKYKCTGSDSGGWCDGVKSGSRMRCKEVIVCKDKTHACRLGVKVGYDIESHKGER